jgi:hypothetical protein
LQLTNRLHNYTHYEQYTQETYHFDLADDKIQAIHAFKVPMEQRHLEFAIKRMNTFAITGRITPIVLV